MPLQGLPNHQKVLQRQAPLDSTLLLAQSMQEVTNTINLPLQRIVNVSQKRCTLPVKTLTTRLR